MRSESKIHVRVGGAGFGDVAGLHPSETLDIADRKVCPNTPPPPVYSEYDGELIVWMCGPIYFRPGEFSYIAQLQGLIAFPVAGIVILRLPMLSNAARFWGERGRTCEAGGQGFGHLGGGSLGVGDGGQRCRQHPPLLQQGLPALPLPGRLPEGQHAHLPRLAPGGHLPL